MSDVPRGQSLRLHPWPRTCMAKTNDPGIYVNDQKRNEASQGKGTVVLPREVSRRQVGERRGTKGRRTYGDKGIDTPSDTGKRLGEVFN